MVSSKTHVPWGIIAVIHEREASQSWKANLAQGDLATMLLRVEPQKLWKGVGLSDAGGVVHHAAFSARAGTSSGSTNSSSSSPR